MPKRSEPSGSSFDARAAKPETAVEPSGGRGSSKSGEGRALLSLVATPIGNLGDITLRALETLRHADAIACEDTRVTAKLLARHGIERPLLSYHEHNARRVEPLLIRRMAEGAHIALVSDAGTPLLSDPGQSLVRAAIDAGIVVTALPGPSALLAALSLSGLPADRFLFAGFPPARSGERRRFLAELARAPATLVFYEAPHRLAASLADMAAALGDRSAAIARELTKRHEEVRRGSLAELAEGLAAGEAPRGEIVVVVAPPAGAGAEEGAGPDLDGVLRDAMGRLSLRDAVAEAAAITGRPRKEVYARALALQGEKR
ncbi:MAG TPA: 16S rRNA (cytidine(1402)-2'-O)-methyltransferase [Methylomirabilota bacterium]|jgi:16S rRNA (cytidine1402-2'-O)-methyltransferase|nr:16S rRNA (cytidine(1402)-2'-O)-methyltransferase [Methylomirabilota bacterium]